MTIGPDGLLAGARYIASPNRDRRPYSTEISLLVLHAISLPRGVYGGEAIERLRRPLPKVAALLEEAEEDLLAFYAFPLDHWPKLRSTNPLERVNREIGRRTDVVGIFPNDKALIRLAASVVIEQNDEWLVGRRYLSAHSLEAVLDREREEDNNREEARELTAA